MDFIAGAMALACGGISLFFLRYWRETRDRLFAIFALAFAIFAVNRIVLSTLEEADEARTLVYLSRLAGFLLIIAAIVDKNRGSAARE